MIFLGILVSILLAVLFSIFIINENKEKIDEVENNRKVTFLIDLESKNVNGRTYDKEALINAVCDYQKYIEEGHAFIYHESPGMQPKLNDVIGVIENIKIAGNDIVVDSRFLPNSLFQKNMQEYIKKNCHLVPMGYGSIKDDKAEFTEIIGYSLVPNRRYKSDDTGPN